MIVMLALLNDGAILSIAYDDVRYRNQPEAWNMRLVIGIATVLGVVGPIATLGLFYLGDRALHRDRPQLQTMMYLTLSVAGHLTIFLDPAGAHFRAQAPGDGGPPQPPARTPAAAEKDEAAARRSMVTAPAGTRAPAAGTS